MIKHLFAGAVCATLLWTQAAELPRELLPTPGIVARPGVASPTRSPWIVANGWRFIRQPSGKFRYDLPAGKAVLAAVEKYVYGADAVVKVDPADAEPHRAITTFLDQVPLGDLPAVADIGVVEDGTPVTGEVMNLLARRNLLYAVVKSPEARFRLNIAMGSREYPVEDAADPSAFALKVRRRLTDDERTLRIFGSEVVIARLTGDGKKVRLHLINYGGREIDGLRVRLRGTYTPAALYLPGGLTGTLEDFSAAAAATEFSLPRFAVYAMVDLAAAR